MSLTRRDFLKSAAAGAGLLAAASSLPRSAIAATRHPVFSDYFGSSLGSHWKKFGGDKFDTSHAFVAGGSLNLVTKRSADGHWRGGGVSLNLPRIYGDYQVRIRFDAGTGTKGVALLWPSDGSWPPEIDFYEIGAIYATRQTSTQTLHYGSNQMIHSNYHEDFTAWHTVGVKWRKDHLTYTCDGVDRRHVDSPHVPSRRMNLHIQSARGETGTPIPTTMQVDWVKVFA